VVKLSSMTAYRKSDGRGLWVETLVTLGASPAHFTGYGGPCPFCGEGEDRFRWTEGDANLRLKGHGRWICNQCQPKGGDGLEFIRKLRGVSAIEARSLREEALSGAASTARTTLPADLLPQPASDGREIQKEFEQERARDWSSAVPLTQWNPAGKYLMRRTGIVPWTPDLRVQKPREPTTVNGKPRYIFKNNDAVLVAMFRSSDGRTTLHRTYIKDGEKAGTRYARGPIPTGGAVELLPVDSRRVLGVAEGIETALSAAKLFNMPVWAALDARNLGHWDPPAELSRIVIFGDNDVNGVGQAAAERLRERLVGAGGKVEVKIPTEVDTDWNDVLRRNLA
jgi:putative DNA primase/helicase